MMKKVMRLDEEMGGCPAEKKKKTRRQTCNSCGSQHTEAWRANEGMVENSDVLRQWVNVC